jgi:hypothetical protein
MAIEKVINIVVKKEGADKNIKGLDKEIKDVDKSTTGLNSSLDKMSGGALSAFNKMKSGIVSVVGGFKSLKFAIAATGIGLLIVAIAAVSAAFKGSEEGQNKFAKIMAVIGAVTGNLIDLLADFGELIIKVFTEPQKVIKDIGDSITKYVTNQIEVVLDGLGLLGSAIKKAFSGDFSGALEDAGKGFKKLVIEGNPALQLVEKLAKETADFAKQNISEGKAAAKVADDRARADKIERDLIIDKAKAENDIAKLRLIAKEQNKFSAKERKEALMEAGDIQDGLIAREKEVLVLRANAIALENTFARSNKENLNAEAEAAAAVIRAETGRVNFKRQLARELTAAQNEEDAIRIEKVKEREKVLADIEKIRVDKVKLEAKTEGERLQKIADIQDEFKKKREEQLANTEIEKLELEKERKIIELTELKATEQQKEDIILFYNNKINNEILHNEKLSNEEQIKDAQLLKNAKVAFAQQGLALVGALAKEGSAIGKGVAVAQATISGIQGVQNAYTTAQGSAIAAVFPAYPAIQAGLAGAFSAIQIKKILSTKTAGAGGGGVQGSSSGPRASAPSFNLVQGTDSNQIAQSINKGNSKPIQAFVLSSEISTQAEMERNKLALGSL